MFVPLLIVAFLLAAAAKPPAKDQNIPPFDSYPSPAIREFTVRGLGIPQQKHKVIGLTEYDPLAVAAYYKYYPQYQRWLRLQQEDYAQFMQCKLSTKLPQHKMLTAKELRKERLRLYRKIALNPCLWCCASMLLADEMNELNKPLDGDHEWMVLMFLKPKIRKEIRKVLANWVDVLDEVSSYNDYDQELAYAVFVRVFHIWHGLHLVMGLTKEDEYSEGLVIGTRYHQKMPIEYAKYITTMRRKMAAMFSDFEFKL